VSNQLSTKLKQVHDGEVQYIGEIDNTEAATRKLVARLEKRSCPSSK
jgi:hypothetical protein